jgi:hypothetical protein
MARVESGIPILRVRERQGRLEKDGRKGGGVLRVHLHARMHTSVGGFQSI